MTVTRTSHLPFQPRRAWRIAFYVPRMAHRLLRTAFHRFWGWSSRHLVDIACAFLGDHEALGRTVTREGVGALNTRHVTAAATDVHTDSLVCAFAVATEATAEDGADAATTRAEINAAALTAAARPAVDTTTLAAAATATAAAQLTELARGALDAWCAVAPLARAGFTVTAGVAAGARITAAGVALVLALGPATLSFRTAGREAWTATLTVLEVTATVGTAEGKIEALAESTLDTTCGPAALALRPAAFAIRASACSSRPAELARLGIAAPSWRAESARAAVAPLRTAARASDSAAGQLALVNDHAARIAAPAAASAALR